ncbi:ImmA/IrrE family metallo-endopeptidase [Roseivirga thermotolerans]|uniref:ImmA/IrrE family metallo-endopeptidase n=1 Tax=Roseivirga thermotolerans TaxID=1758176 RepID=UPI00273D64DC|nr:ImmA/IrrE family metallo-endopeptidase [Roseivirga thermotolerans]
MSVSRGQLAARKFLESNGFENIIGIPLNLIASGLGAIVVEKPMAESDGRIVFGNRKSIITINSGIEFLGKKRHTLAHEIGHLLLHKDQILIHNDTEATLEYFQRGNQETEANEFASELLMPEREFRKEANKHKFSPDLIRHLADHFSTSITAVAYRYFKHGNHPICLIYSYNGKVKYWLRPDPYDHFLIDRKGLSPPDDSVAMEFFLKGKIYRKDQSKQQIWKSTWFELRNWENDNDFNFYEYCIVTPKYNTVLSIVWEE